MTVKELEFEDFKQFVGWKEEEELNQKTRYIQKCAPYSDGNYKTWYYYCNRTGTYKPRGKKIRHLKSQGTSKIAKQCTAHIKATVTLDTGTVKVQYCDTHHSHHIKLAHLRMHSSTRMNIAAKLQQGVSMDRIMDDIRETVSKELNREHLISRQDLHNIKKQYNIDGVIRHQNDLISTSAWVEDMKNLKYNSVLLFKRQGEEQNDHMDNVSDKDFILCLQTEFQRDMLIKFGSNVICIDSTHGTNAYDFYLTTLLVLDEYEEGIQVGWMISNREDTLMLMLFFNAIKERGGDIHPKWLCRTWLSSITQHGQQYLGIKKLTN